ncbi:MAG TPA: arsenosugar biosynthesis radical SAM (seleno)protein ArsS [Mariprofundaceae bacterium]|nr:arsenosugar biosynthesis radical SAM (seleno)protein ArsS [Mariprofundaceae bacterium]
MHATLPLLQTTDFPPLTRGRLETLQVNLGYLCNQTCIHCHVNAGPRRSEVMDAATIRAVLDFLAVSGVARLDLTGGAPEMNPHFRQLVTEARTLGVAVTDRCNLTILEEPGCEVNSEGREGPLGGEDLAGFLASQSVEIVASLPCYLESNVNAQRGKGVYERSIAGLKRLNALGYGRGGELKLNLVYNPAGASLPPEQEALEAAYKRELVEQHGIVFDRLFTITNMPIKRFGSWLLSKGQFEAYMQLLKDAYRPENLEAVMCRTLVSVDWQGYLYDCDFNQMLGLPLQHAGRPKTHLSQLLGQSLEGSPIVVMDHCYGCTAGQGSSCGGALE